MLVGPSALARRAVGNINSKGMWIEDRQCKILDNNDEEMPRGEVGRLAVRGPTGCRYLADDRQSSYVKNGWNITRAIDNLWKYCRKKISGPGFLVGVPLTVSPLAKKMQDKPELTQRFQPIIAGSELGNGYSELNDPIDQAEWYFPPRLHNQYGYHLH